MFLLQLLQIVTSFDNTTIIWKYLFLFANKNDKKSNIFVQKHLFLLLKNFCSNECIEMFRQAHGCPNEDKRIMKFSEFFLMFSDHKLWSAKLISNIKFTILKLFKKCIWRHKETSKKDFNKLPIFWETN